MPVETKKPWFSKTILINSLLGVCLGLSPFIPSLQGVVDFIKNNLIMIGVIWSGLAVFLRVISKGSISLED